MTAKPLPPIWLLASAYAPIGILGAVALLTFPQILAAQHVPEPVISHVTGLFLAPLFIAFLFSPVLDVWFRRRTYSAVFNLAAAAFTIAALLAHGDPNLVGVLLFLAGLSVNMSGNAVGGWLGSLVPREDDSRLGAGMIAYNVGSFGVTAIIGIGLFRALPYPLGPIALGGLVALPCLVLPFIPAPAPDSGLARESFGRFSIDVLSLLRQPAVLQALVLFGLPAATFALTNTLGGLGRDYAASEGFVALVGGVGVTVAGVAGSLLVPSLGKRLPPRPLYLAVGIAGALFTLSQIVMPKTPTSFLIALMGQNIFQAAAFALVNLVAFRAIGKDNPLAATTFALIYAAQGLPLTYMQVIDGHAYGAGGLTGLYLCDAGLGLAACLALSLMFWLLDRRRRAREAAV